MRDMMKCGCAANATCSSMGGEKYDPPIPCCVIHDCIEVMEEKPDLTGRKSMCGYGDKKGGNFPAVADSDWNLPFFEYRGPGSQEAEEKCKCGYHKVAHGKPHIKCKKFEAHGPYEHDKHYCGCCGWN